MTGLFMMPKQLTHPSGYWIGVDLGNDLYRAASGHHDDMS
jgi:hypothetical protein